MASISKEERMKMAIDAFIKGQFTSKKACAKAFDVPPTTFRNRLDGTASRKDTLANNRKLSDLEEETLRKWIIDMYERGLGLGIPRIRYLAQLLLSARLRPQLQPKLEYLSERWVFRFIEHKNLQTKWNSRYDYQRAKCEDPQLIHEWFNLVQNTIQKYGILEQDIYNMDETGFQLGTIATAKVVCGSETHVSQAKTLQPGNTEWASVIVTINASGWVLPPHIILTGKKHISTWYSVLPRDQGYKISTSDNGWTTNNLGFEWLRDIFEPNTALKTIGRYRLLIIDGHGSHGTPQFDQFCTEQRIIPLYMPPHSSHLLQPLDVSCFRPLKHFYGQKTQEMMHNGINFIDKVAFLTIYSSIHQHTFSTVNISSGFSATGLVPHQPERVLSKLKLKLKTPTLPGSSNSNQSFQLGKTPRDLYQLNRQKQQLQELENQAFYLSIAEQALQKVIKGAEGAMQKAVLLEQENRQLRTANEYQKQKKKERRFFIQDEGSLTVEEAIEKIKEKEEAIPIPSTSSSQRRPMRCSNCGQEGHNRLKCPTK